MIDVLLPGLSAAVAVGCTMRAVLLTADVRVSAGVRRRLAVGGNLSALDRLRSNVATGVAAITSPFERRFGDAGRQRRADRDVLLLLESTTRRLRSGASLRLAIAAAADDCSDPIDRSLAPAIASGAPLRTILDTWILDASSARVLVGTALGLAADSGGAVATVLDGVAESLRDRLALDREVTALSSQARASALVLIIAPAVFAVLMATVDPRVATVQFTTPIGWACCALGLALDLLGAAWMSRLINRVR